MKNSSRSKVQKITLLKNHRVRHPSCVFMYHNHKKQLFEVITYLNLGGYITLYRKHDCNLFM